MPVPDSLLVAIGGNATHPENIRGTTEEQEVVADTAARALLPLVKSHNRLLITHGNGPVVGKILLRMMLTRDSIPPMRLDVCVAHSQGGIVVRAAHNNKMVDTGDTLVIIAGVPFGVGGQTNFLKVHNVGESGELGAE